MGKTRNLFKKIRFQGNISCKDGHNKGQKLGDSQGQGSLVGCHLWSRTKSDTTEATQQQQQKVKSLSCVQLFATPWTVVCQASPSMGFSSQEYWSELPFPSPGNFPDPGIEPRSPTLQADSLLSEPAGQKILRRGGKNTQKNYTKKDLHDPDNH